MAKHNNLDSKDADPVDSIQLSNDDDYKAGASSPHDSSSQSIGAFALVRHLNRSGDALLSLLAAHPRMVQVGIWTLVVTSIAVGVWMWYYDKFEIEQAGYSVVFYSNLVGSASIFIPVPGIIAICFAAEESLGLNLWLLGAIGASGAAIGETTAYLAGYSGHNAVENIRWYPRIHNLVERRGGVTIFMLSVIPNPVFDIAGIAAGALGYPYKKFIVYTFTGKVIRLLIMAYACRESIEWLMSFLNLRIGGIS